jgi:hypothetical protein
MRVVRFLPFIVVLICGCVAVDAQEMLWGKRVVRKNPESSVDLGGDIQFRLVAPWIDCKTGCFENPWHIGELWSGSRMLGRGLSDPHSCCSLSPSKRFIVFKDDRVRLFDHNSGQLLDVTDQIPGEPSVPESEWYERARHLAVKYYRDKKAIAVPSVIRLPD